MLFRAADFPSVVVRRSQFRHPVFATYLCRTLFHCEGQEEVSAARHIRPCEYKPVVQVRQELEGRVVEKCDVSSGAAGITLLKNLDQNSWNQRQEPVA